MPDQPKQIWLLLESHWDNVDIHAAFDDEATAKRNLEHLVCHAAQRGREDMEPNLYLKPVAVTPAGTVLHPSVVGLADA